MWSDSETDVDFLNYSEVAEIIVDLVADKNLLPLSLGVFGGWGTGKSSTLRLVEHELKKEPDKYLIVKFDAWLYQGFDDARAALMGVISSALIEASPPSLKDKAAKLLGRVNKLRLLGLVLEGGALALGMPTFGVLNKGVTAAASLFGGKGSEVDVAAVKHAAQDAQTKATGLLNPAGENGPPEEIDAFRAEFGEVLETLGKTLIVFIDNLDRCLPDNAIQTLEAVRLFLFMPSTAFVVAADEDMIRHAVSQHFHNPTQRHVTDYLDKLIQVPVRVPRTGVQEVRAYLFLLLASRSNAPAETVEKMRLFLIERLRRSWSRDSDFSVKDMLEAAGLSADKDLLISLDMADRIAPILAHSSGVLGNPRTVKRMLNVVRMRAGVARRRSMPLDEAMITKLALFERCTDSDATEQLQNLINSAPDGKPEILTVLESAKPGEKGPELPEFWTKHADFVRNWANLQPSLAGIDLRPAVYLARESVPLRMTSTSLSAQSLRVVEILQQTQTVASPSAKNAIDSLRAEEVSPVMEALIGEMRKDPGWERTRSDFRGAIMLADKSEAAAALLMAFMRSLQLPRTPGWISTMLKGKAWWQE